MPILTEFHEPADLPAALALLRRKHPRTVPIAGGTWLTPRLGKLVQAEAVVDLSRLGLDSIEHSAEALGLGAMATLGDVAKDETCARLANGLLAQTARRDAVVNVRNAATVGGTLVVAPPDSEFILALLALGAEVSVQSAQVKPWPLDRFLADPAAALDGGLVTRVRIPLPRRAGGGLARVARTGSDHPIVSAVAAVVELEAKRVARIALGGVARRPLLVELDRLEAGEAVAQAIAAAETCADFRGTAEYRREMGRVLARRALEQAANGEGEVQ